MARVPQRPRGANLPSVPAAPERRTFIRLDDPADLKRWLETLRSVVADVVAAGEDATRRASERVLSRVEARRKIVAADERIASILGLAERGVERAP